jgi:hypothetical protein
LNTVEEPYRFERITPGSYPHLVTLMRRCFGIEVPLERIRAKFNTSSFGAADIGYLAFAPSGSVAAYYGVFPVRVRSHGEILLAAQSGDTMTDPEHQKRGLFIKLAKLTYALARNEGVRFIFGFPNENSFPGFQNKLDWKFAGRLREFRLRQTTIPLCEIAGRFGKLQPAYDAFVAHRLARYTLGPEKEGSAFDDGSGDMLLHDGRFMEYKRTMGAKPIIFGGFAMVVKAHTHLYVGEVARIPEDRLTALLGALRRLARRLFCRTIVLTLSPDHWLYTMLAHHMPSVESLPIGYLVLDGSTSPVNLTFGRIDLDTF